MSRESKRQKLVVWEEQNLAKRPPRKPATSGKSIPILGNFFRMQIKDAPVIFQYHVTYEPDLQSMSHRRSLLAEHKEALGYVFIAHGESLYLKKKLPNPSIVVNSQLKMTKVDYKITITFTNEVKPEENVMIYNIIFKKLLQHMQLQQLGRHYYNAEQKREINALRLELWPGYSTSVDLREGGLMLNADLTWKILHIDNVYKVYRDKGPEKLQNILEQQIVITRYNHKTYRISAIDNHKSPRSTFKQRSGEEISFVDYYQRTYGIQVQHMDQPLLLSKIMLKGRGEKLEKEERVVHLIPELCNLTGLDDETKSDHNVMKEIHNHTRSNAPGRMKQIEDFVEQLNRQDQVSLGGRKPQEQERAKRLHEELKRWNLRVEPRMIRIEGRVFPPSKIVFSDRQFPPNDRVDWSDSAKKGCKLLKPIPLNEWFIIFTRRDTRVANDFCNTSRQVAGPLGINIAEPTKRSFDDDRADSFVRAIQEVAAPTTKMIVCILPTNRSDRYNAIKNQLIVKTPVPSQCIASKTLQKPRALMTVCTKVVQQMQAKIGAELWKVEIPVTLTMVIGIDVHHSRGKKSWMGFSASTNQNFTQYFSRVMQQERGDQELAGGLRTCFVEAIKAFAEKNNKSVPTRIIVYRDGVGRGQLRAVVEFEVEALRAAFSEIPPYKDKPPHYAFVIVKKRINARFFHQNDNRIDNPPPGTVIDSQVVHPTQYDFYLVSQFAGQGSVSPTHYHVIADSSGLATEHLQQLTFKLCFMYFNWSGTISVPAPVQYAHRIAFLVGQSVGAVPHKRMAQWLFFL